MADLTMELIALRSSDGTSANTFGPYSLQTLSCCHSMYSVAK